MNLLCITGCSSFCLLISKLNTFTNTYILAQTKDSVNLGGSEFPLSEKDSVSLVSYTHFFFFFLNEHFKRD